MLFETQRIVVRPLTVQDARALHAIYCVPHMTDYLGDGRAYELTHAEEQQRVKSHIENYYKKHGFGLWATVLKSSGELIGRSGLLSWNIAGAEEVEIAYLVAKHHWGNGYATEIAQGVKKYAFEHYGFKRLISIIYKNNAASIRVAEKIGMAFEKEVTLSGKRVLLYSVQH